MRLGSGRQSIAACIALGIASLIIPVQAQESSEGPAQQEHAAAQENESAMVARTARTITFESLGERYPIRLHGVDVGRSLPFSVRADEVVSAARLNLNYAYSPALLEELSQLNISLNDETVATLDLPRADAGRNVSASLVLPAHLMAVFNQLKMQFLGHYTMECEDPLHSSLWVSISKNSFLELETAPLLLPDELALLPVPFFDPRDNRLLTLPMVLDASPDDQALEAAGILASWFGAMADYRGARFPVSLDAVPRQGNAVVMQQGEAAQRWLAEPLRGPTIAMMTHPDDPAAKLLLVLGRDSAELRQAAAVLAVGAVALSGPVAEVGGLVTKRPRQPYDAPRWLATDKPVQLGALTTEGGLSVSGYDPGTMRLNLRLPPDLFDWQGADVPLDLKYRYTPQPTARNSSLLVGANEQYLRSYPLVAQDHPRYAELVRGALGTDGDALQHVSMTLPLTLLADRGQLQFRFMYDYLKEGICRDIIVDNVRGSIDPTSTLDFTGYAHYKAMPDLAAFVSSGWPFTRMADLADTQVLLDAEPGAQALSAYLEVMGRFGESTGFPVLALQVSRERSPAGDGKDLLVLTAAPGRVRELWGETAPAAYDVGQQHFFQTSDIAYQHASGKSGAERLAGSAWPARSEIGFFSAGDSAIVAGFESPVTPQRSVVLFASANEKGLLDAARAMQVAGMRANMPELRNDKQAPGSANHFDGSLVVVRGEKVDVLVAESTYFVGELSLWQRWRWWWQNGAPLSWLDRYGWLAVLGLCIVLIGVVGWFGRATGQQRLSWRWPWLRHASKRGENGK
ncbi:hypothetical protein KESI111651_16305 [Kerstersia similis]